MPDNLELPREDLVRMTSLPTAHVEFRDDDETDGRLLVGMPIVFNRWTEINGWEGHFLERIAPGALSKTLAERGDQVKVLYDHGADPSIGNKPLGKPRVMDVRGDGLYVEVPLARTSYNDDLIELMRAGALDGMSFRFSVTKHTIDDQPERSEHNPAGLPERTIDELRLYEFGPVTFPAYQATTVGVRAQAIHRHLPQITADPEAAAGTSGDASDKPPVRALVGVRERARMARRRWNTSGATSNSKEGDTHAA